VPLTITEYGANTDGQAVLLPRLTTPVLSAVVAVRDEFDHHLANPMGRPRGRYLSMIST